MPFQSFHHNLTCAGNNQRELIVVACREIPNRSTCCLSHTNHVYVLLQGSNHGLTCASTTQCHLVVVVLRNKIPNRTTSDFNYITHIRVLFQGLNSGIASTSPKKERTSAA